MDLHRSLDNLLEDAPDSNLSDNDYECALMEWHRVCGARLAEVSRTCNAWLLLAGASLALHSKQVGLSRLDKDNCRLAILAQPQDNPRACKGLLRMTPAAFNGLCNILRDTRLIKPNSDAAIAEQLATFLFIIGQKFTNRAIMFFLCRSGETISRYFHNVLRAIISLEFELLQQANGGEVAPEIKQNNKYFPYFKVKHACCIIFSQVFQLVSILDDDFITTLGNNSVEHCRIALALLMGVRVKVVRVEAARYRGRKEWPTQNVLACCSFDMRFTYVLAGWEGSASDSKVLKSVLTRDDALHIPQGKYLIADAGYGLSSKVLTPYGRTRYHLKEYSVRAPRNCKELFNLCHASLRNTIERSFGVLKKRFPILGSGAECQYSNLTMTKIVLACYIIHNIILGSDEFDILYLEEGNPITGGSYGQMECENVEMLGAAEEYNSGVRLRDEIAMKMWEDYYFPRMSN